MTIWTLDRAFPRKGLKSGTFALAGLMTAIFAVAGGAPVLAAADYVGPEKCTECHKAESDVWQKTKHFESFKTIRSRPEVKDIVAAAGGSADMGRNEIFVLVHFTVVGNKPVAGPSCESCHGPASNWITVHNDYGGPGVKRETEDPAHKTKRIENAVAAGMVRPNDKYALATNCLSCHGMANASLDGTKLGAMVAAGHPVSGYELVQYSQGSVRHRFYPPDVTVNQEMSPAELARLYAVGQAASLVVASEAIGKSNEAKYVSVQQARIDRAKKTLEALKGTVPEAAAVLAKPTEANGKAFAKAVESKDLTGALGGMMPKKDGYK